MKDMSAPYIMVKLQDLKLFMALWTE